MAQKVVVVGRKVPPSGACRGWKAMPVPDFEDGRVRDLSPVIVVLGDGAVSALEPPRVRRAVRGGLVRLVVAAPGAAAPTIAAWARAQPDAVFTAEADWIDRTIEIQNQRLRPSIELSDWLGSPPRNPDASCLVDALQGVEVVRVGAWAASVGLSADALTHRCRAQFGVSARDMCARYVVACALRLRADGLTWSACADAVGFADAATLHRTVRRVRGGGGRCRQRLAACDRVPRR